MKVVVGDLLDLALEGKFDVIIHGCNCQCTMGAGISKAIRLRFPEAYEADLQTEKGKPEKLGDISVALVDRSAVRFEIVNGYTQLHWRGRGVKVDYDAIRNVMKRVKKQFTGKRIGYPLIGAGLAGGDWQIISKIIDAELEGEDHMLVKWS